MGPKTRGNKFAVEIEIVAEEGMPAPIDRGPGRVQERPHPLEEKIEEAIAHIEADYCKEAAIQFLRRTSKKLESVKRPSRKCQALCELIKAALSDYGDYGPLEEKV